MVGHLHSKAGNFSLTTTPCRALYLRWNAMPLICVYKIRKEERLPDFQMFVISRSTVSSHFHIKPTLTNVISTRLQSSTRLSSISHPDTRLARHPPRPLPTPWPDLPPPHNPHLQAHFEFLPQTCEQLILHSLFSLRSLKNGPKDVRSFWIILLKQWFTSTFQINEDTLAKMPE